MRSQITHSYHPLSLLTVPSSIQSPCPSHTGRLTLSLPRVFPPEEFLPPFTFQPVYLLHKAHLQSPPTHVPNLLPALCSTLHHLTE